MLDYDNNLYCWGSNSKGQLGLGHINNSTKVVGNDLIPKDSKIVEVKAKGHRSYVILDDGRVFTWPYEKSKSEV